MSFQGRHPESLITPCETRGIRLASWSKILLIALICSQIACDGCQRSEFLAESILRCMMDLSAGPGRDNLSGDEQRAKPIGGAAASNGVNDFALSGENNTEGLGISRKASQSLSIANSQSAKVQVATRAESESGRAILQAMVEIAKDSEEDQRSSTTAIQPNGVSPVFTVPAGEVAVRAEVLCTPPCELRTEAGCVLTSGKNYCILVLVNRDGSISITCDEVPSLPCQPL